VSAASAGADPLAAALSDEWALLVAAAVVGTDRRPPPPPAFGWEAWAGSVDPAVQVLDRAAAVVAARRAGAVPAPPPAVLPEPAPDDERPPCPPACARRLERLLAGEHEVVVHEWLRLADAAGIQLPWASLPSLLLRGRREPALDRVVRRLARGRDRWLAAAVPELGVPVAPVRAAGAGEPDPGSPGVGTLDGGAAVTAIVGAFHEGSATWHVAPQLRAVVAALDPAWLAALVVELSRLAFDARTERTRAELLSLAELRAEMHREFASLRAGGPGHAEGAT